MPKLNLLIVLCLLFMLPQYTHAQSYPPLELKFLNAPQFIDLINESNKKLDDQHSFTQVKALSACAKNTPPNSPCLIQNKFTLNNFSFTSYCEGRYKNNQNFIQGMCYLSYKDRLFASYPINDNSLPQVDKIYNLNGDELIYISSFMQQIYQKSSLSQAYALMIDSNGKEIARSYFDLGQDQNKNYVSFFTMSLNGGNSYLQGIINQNKTNVKTIDANIWRYTNQQKASYMLNIQNNKINGPLLSYDDEGKVKYNVIFKDNHPISGTHYDQKLGRIALESFRLQLISESISLLNEFKSIIDPSSITPYLFENPW